MHARATRRHLTAFVIVLLTLTGPLLPARVTAQDGDAILRVQHSTYPAVVDPQKSANTNEIDILTLAYEGLTRLDTGQQTVPAAAESWEYNEDATQITFHLRDGLKYSDGSPLTAENFRYAVERTCDPNTAGEYQSILFEIVGCAEFASLAIDADGNPREFTDEEYEAARSAVAAKALDDRTLQLDLTNPAPYYHTVASLWVFAPVKQEIVAADPDNWWKAPATHIGNGPFMVTGIDEDQRWTFAANDTYWQGQPKLDGIEYRYVEDAAVALEAYRTGDLDIVQLEPPQIIEVLADPALAPAYVTYPLAATATMEMNLILEPFADRKVREAFAYAFDRETFCTDVLVGGCTPTLSWIPPGTPGALATDRFAFDPAAAQRSLTESSYGGPEGLPEVQVFYNSDLSGARENMEWIAGQYRDILGIELRLEPTDGTTLIDLMADPTTHPQLVLFGGWAQDYPDPQNWLSVYWTCDSSFAQRVGYCDEAFDQLTLRADTTVDPAERLRDYEQAGQILVDQQPAPFIFNAAGTFLVNPAVTGYATTPAESEWPGSISSLMTIDKT